MIKNNVVELKGRDTLSDPISELLIAGARKLIAQAVEPDNIASARMIGK